jgi:hypothetical protein
MSHLPKIMRHVASFPTDLRLLFWDTYRSSRRADLSIHEAVDKGAAAVLRAEIKKRRELKNGLNYSPTNPYKEV